MWRRDELLEIGRWHRFRAVDHILYGDSGKHKLRDKQHAELGDKWRSHGFDFSRWIQLRVGERLNDREPGGDDGLHADRNQRFRLGDVHGNSHRNYSRHANNQLVCSQPDEHQFRFRQHPQLGDKRSDDHCHHAGNIHVYIGEWFDGREPDGDDDLYADSDQ